MTSPVNIPRIPRNNAFTPSTSPVSSFFSRHRDSFINDPIRQPKILHPIEKNDQFRLLLLENISIEAVHTFKAHGFHVDHYAHAFSEEELVQNIGRYHALGIRSKTRVTSRVISAASKVRFFYSSRSYF